MRTPNAAAENNIRGSLVLKYATIVNESKNPAIRNPRPDTGGRGITWDETATWITVNPTTLAETTHTTKYDDANKNWEAI